MFFKEARLAGVRVEGEGGCRMMEDFAVSLVERLGYDFAFDAMDLSPALP